MEQRYQDGLDTLWLPHTVAWKPSVTIRFQLTVEFVFEYQKCSPHPTAYKIELLMENFDLSLENYSPQPPDLAHFIWFTNENYLFYRTIYFKISQLRFISYLSSLQQEKYIVFKVYRMYTELTHNLAATSKPWQLYQQYNLTSTVYVSYLKFMFRLLMSLIFFRFSFLAEALCRLYMFIIFRFSNL